MLDKPYFYLWLIFCRQTALETRKIPPTTSTRRSWRRRRIPCQNRLKLPNIMCDAASDRDVRDLGCKKIKLNSPGRYTNAIRIYLSKRFYRFYRKRSREDWRLISTNWRGTIYTKKAKQTVRLVDWNCNSNVRLLVGRLVSLSVGRFVGWTVIIC